MIKDENINCTIEALILASPEPLPVKKIADALGDVSSARVRQGIDDLNNIYMGCGCSFRVREIGGGYQIHILPDFEQPIKRLLAKQRTVRLTRAALETLAIVAYKQPVTKTDLEHIRGVASDGVIHNLMERKLVLIAGRAETPGRPLLYKTSHEFLKFFGLNRLSDLPRMDEIEDMIKQSETPKEQTVLQLGDNGNGSESMVVLDKTPDILDTVTEEQDSELSVAEIPEVDKDDISTAKVESESDLPEIIETSDAFNTAVTDIPVLESEPNPESTDADEIKPEGSGITLPAARFEAEHYPPSETVNSHEQVDSQVFEIYEPLPDVPPPIKFEKTDAAVEVESVISVPSGAKPVDDETTQ
ncbi:MAG: SMC-Scp complex subunit ScpB [candidate division Zixibacteria bacterium]|nr:SMC-Scp complex subunit ScpB [candidate division Zixibacteria bacterium]